MTVPRTGPFWEMLEGRRPPPPSAALLGWRLVAVDPEAGIIRAEFEARPEFLNPLGTVQGGFLAAMLDDTMGPAATAFLGGTAFAQTLELKTSFHRPGRLGRLYAEGRVVHRGREIVFLEGRLTSPEGELIASASATARIVPFTAGPDGRREAQ